MAGYAFATPDHVAARWRPLTAAETVIAETLCLDASALLRARFPGIDGRITSGDLDPYVAVMVCAGMVKRALVTPDDGVSQEASTSGPFTRSQSFANPMRTVFLTAADTILILGYQPGAITGKYANDTVRVENSSPAYVYGF